jgi:hypothetical protein
MRFAWTVAGDDVDFNAVRAHGVNGLYAPLWDSLTTNSYVRSFLDNGFQRGVYVGHGWWAPISPSTLATKTVAEYEKVAAGIPNVRIQMNLEQHDPHYIEACLREIRQLLPKVNLSWSPEGMQGGWMSPGFVKEIIDLRVRVVPQAFTGDMSPRAEDQVLRNLTRRGFPETSVSLFYDAAALPRDWDGFAFTAGRLP